MSASASMQPPLLPTRRLDAVEAARGLCAGYVVLAHVFQILGYRYALMADWPLLVDLASGYAHQAVLFFFLLSGFSIHYVSVDRPMTRWPQIRHYLYLRWRRVYPIFALTVLAIIGLYGLGLALELPHYQKIWKTLDWREVWATLGFVVDREYVCGHWFEPMPTNPPFWSLSYEMSYYLIYPAFHALRQRFGIGWTTLLGVALSVAAAAWNRHDCSHFGNVISLYGYWCLGALVAEHVRNGRALPLPRWLGYLAPLLALLAIWTIHESRLAEWDVWLWVAVLFPLLAWGTSSAAQQRMRPSQQLLLTLLGLLPAALLYWLSTRHAISSNTPMFQSRLLSVCAIWLALLWIDGRLGLSAALDHGIKRVAWLGGISYALYLIHYPLLVFARELLLRIDGPRAAALLVLPLTLYLAYLLEKQLQPRIVARLERWLGRAPAARPPLTRPSAS